MSHVIAFYHSKRLSVYWEAGGATLLEIDQARVGKRESDSPAITKGPFFTVVLCLARDLSCKVLTIKKPKPKQNEKKKIKKKNPKTKTKTQT